MHLQNLDRLGQHHIAVEALEPAEPDLPGVGVQLIQALHPHPGEISDPEVARIAEDDHLRLSRNRGHAVQRVHGATQQAIRLARLKPRLPDVVARAVDQLADVGRRGVVHEPDRVLPVEIPQRVVQVDDFVRGDGVGRCGRLAHRAARHDALRRRRAVARRKRSVFSRRERLRSVRHHDLAHQVDPAVEHKLLGHLDQLGVLPRRERHFVERRLGLVIVALFVRDGRGGALRHRRHLERSRAAHRQHAGAGHAQDAHVHQRRDQLIAVLDGHQEPALGRGPHFHRCLLPRAHIVAERLQVALLRAGLVLPVIRRQETGIGAGRLETGHHLLRQRIDVDARLHVVTHTILHNFDSPLFHVGHLRRFRLIRSRCRCVTRTLWQPGPQTFRKLRQRPNLSNAQRARLCRRRRQTELTNRPGLDHRRPWPMHPFHKVRQRAAGIAQHARLQQFQHIVRILRAALQLRLHPQAHLIRLDLRRGAQHRRFERRFAAVVVEHGPAAGQFFQPEVGIFRELFTGQIHPAEHDPIPANRDRRLIHRLDCDPCPLSFHHSPASSSAVCTAAFSAASICGRRSSSTSMSVCQYPW